MDGYVRKLMNSLDMNIEINMYSLEMKMYSSEINMCARTHTRIESVEEPVVVECDTTHVRDTYIRTHVWQDAHVCAIWHAHSCDRTRTYKRHDVQIHVTGHTYHVQHHTPTHVTRHTHGTRNQSLSFLPTPISSKRCVLVFISRGKNQGIKPPTDKVSDLSKTTHFDKLPTFFRNVTLYPGVFAKVTHLKACDSLRMCLLMRHTHICATRCTHTYDSTRTYVRYDTHTHTCDRTHTYTW